MFSVLPTTCSKCSDVWSGTFGSFTVADSFLFSLYHEAFFLQFQSLPLIFFVRLQTIALCVGPWHPIVFVSEDPNVL